MTVKRKASAKLPIPAIQQVINKGGKTTQELNIPDDDDVRFTLRIPKQLLEQIDTIRKTRVGNVSRNQWILETLSKIMGN